MNQLTETYHPFEVLTLKEFAIRMKVGRTKIFEWKRNGTLIPGRHFIQNGRIQRFIWRLDLIQEIHASQRQLPKDDNKQFKPQCTRKHRQKNNCTINLDY